MIVSAIVTAKGIPLYIGTALDSLLAQTRQPDEVIISLDGSPDQTMDFVARRLTDAGYPIPWRLIQSSRPQGTAETRNAGIMAAKGDILAFLDGDDWYLPDKIFRSEIVVLNGINFLATFSGFYYLHEKGKVEKANPWNPLPEDQYKSLEKECFPMTNSVFLKKAFEEIGLFNPKYEMAEDYDWWERYLQKHTVHMIPDPLFVYRRHRSAKVEDGYIRANKERAEIQERVRRNLNAIS